MSETLDDLRAALVAAVGRRRDAAGQHGDAAGRDGGDADARTAARTATATVAATVAWPAADTARAALDALDADAAGLGVVDAALTEVGDLFGLGPAALAVLAAAALPELHPAAHVLTGLLSGDEGPARPTVAVALELAGLGVTDTAARDLLDPRAPLRATGLLDVVGDDVLIARRLRVPDRVAARLVGSYLVVPEVARVLVAAEPVDVDGHAEVAAALDAGEPFVWVHAPIGTAGLATAVAACRALDVTCLAADLDRLSVHVDGTADRAVDPGLVRRTVRALALEAGLEGSVLVLAGADLAVADLDVLTQAVVPVVAVGRVPWDPRWGEQLPVGVTAGRLTRAQREELWHDAVGPRATTAEVLALRTTPQDIAVVGRRATADAARDGREPTAEDVRRAVRRLGAGHSSRVSSSGTPATLDDLVLPEHTRREVERLIGWARDRDEVLALGDLQGKGGKGTGICALFSGSPGTGKTLAAHVVADCLGADLFQVDLSTVVDKYIGETEKNLERIFAQAEQLNAVLFFDEADSLFGSRSAVNDARDRYANQEVAYLLQRMEAFEGITVLATNLRGNLDPAFARRLHFMIHFPDPDSPTRALLWRHHLDQLPGTDPDDPVDVDLLAQSLEIAGGDIRNIVLAATYDAVAAGGLVGMAGLRVAALREMAKLGRRVADERWTAADR